MQSGSRLYGKGRKPAQSLGTGMSTEKAVQRKRSRSRGRPDNVVDFLEIQTLAGDFGGGGETCTARKSYAKEMRG